MFGRPSHRAKVRKRRLILIIICIAAAGTVAFLFFTGRFPALVFGNGSVRSIHSSLPDNIQSAGEGFLYSEGSQLFLLSRGGTETWSLNVGLADIHTNASDELILNYSGPNLQVMRFSKEQLFATSVDGDILGGAAGDNYVAVLIDAPPGDETVEQMIYIFDNTGQKSTQISVDCQVTDFGFFSDDTQSDLFWVSSLDTSGAAPISRVTLYNKTNGEVSNTITITDRIVEKVYVTSKLIFVCGSGILSAHSYFGEQQYELPVYGFKPVAAAVEPLNFSIVFEPRAASPHIETVLTCQVKESESASNYADNRFTLPMNILAAAISPSEVFAFSRDTMYVYSFDGKLQRSQNLGADITTVKQVSNDYAILWGKQGNTYILRLR